MNGYPGIDISFVFTNNVILLQNVQQFRATVGSVETIFKLYSKVSATLKKLRKSTCDRVALTDAQSSINECKAWLSSCDQFMKSLVTEFAEYTDVIMPVVYSMSQVRVSDKFEEK